MKNPTGKDGGETGMRKPSHLHTQKSTLKVEDEKFLIIVVGVIIYLLIIGGVI